MATNDVTPIFENLPVELNLGQNDQIVGWANATRDPESRWTTITIILDAQSSDKLGNLAEVFDLKAIGFAGIKRRSQ